MVKLYFGGELEFGLPPTAAGLEAYLGRQPATIPDTRRLLGIDRPAQ